MQRLCAPTCKEGRELMADSILPLHGLVIGRTHHAGKLSVLALEAKHSAPGTRHPAPSTRHPAGGAATALLTSDR